MSQELDRVVVKSVIYTSGERDPRVPAPRPPDNGKLYLMAGDPHAPGVTRMDKRGRMGRCRHF